MSVFISKAWGVVEPGVEYVHGWHIDAIADHLTAVTNGEIRNLIINVPPRSMKSLNVSVFWPCWSWTRQPELRWMFGSYAEELALRDSVKCRRLVLSKWYQDRWGKVFTLSGDQNQKRKFENDKGGYRLALGVGSGATGEGGDIIVCLPYQERVATECGMIPIGDIVSFRLGYRVKTYNHDTDSIEWQPIERYEQNESRPMIEIDLDDRTLRCTEDHPVFVVGKGYVRAGDILPGDEVVVDG